MFKIKLLFVSVYFPSGLAVHVIRPVLLQLLMSAHGVVVMKMKKFMKLVSKFVFISENYSRIGLFFRINALNTQNKSSCFVTFTIN